MLASDVLRREERKNQHLFFAYRVISRCYFHLPVLLFYFWNIEIGMYRIIFLLAIYGLASTFSAGITAGLLKAFSPRRIVAAGELTKALGLLLLLWSTRQSEVNLPALALAQIVGGVGFTVALTTDAGLLRQVTGGDQARFMQMQSASQSWMFIATLVAGSLGSVLFDYNPQWPFLAAVVMSLLAAGCILAIGIEEVAPGPAATGVPQKLAVRKDQRFWMLFYAISRAFTLAPFIGFIPFYFIMVNVDPLLFGAVLSCFTLSAWAAIKVGQLILSRYGVTALLAITALLMIGSLWLFGSSERLAGLGIDYFLTGLIALALLGFGSGAIRPVTMANLDLSANTPAERTQIFSRMELDFGIANALLLAIGGWLLVEHGIFQLMQTFAGLYILTVGLLAAMNAKK